MISKACSSVRLFGLASAGFLGGAAGAFGLMIPSGIGVGCFAVITLLHFNQERQKHPVLIFGAVL
ncbi:hypothetical protein D3C81_1942810 [compost metagenome]